MPEMLQNRNRRILVVDDTPDLHEDYRRILNPRRAGSSGMAESESVLFGDEAPGGPEAADATPFEIASALQGVDALRQVEAAVHEGRPFAMAFVDVRMPPGWDGIETVKRLWQVQPDLQVVICTAYSDYSAQQILDQLGQRDSLLILRKPFEAVEVIQLAHSLTQKWTLARVVQARLDDLEKRVDDRTQELLVANARLEETNRLLEQESLRNRKLAEAATAASRAKSEFLATMSHELRTPLNGVLGFADLLQTTPLSSDQQEIAGLIHQSGSTLLGIINTILDYVQLESGEMEIEQAPMSLSAVLGAAVAAVQPEAAAKGLTLELDLSGVPAQPVHGDATRLKQVLLNLLGNAVKFTDNGSVRVTCGLVDGPAPGHPSVRMNIRDTGIGIASERRDELFLGFQQLDGSTTRRHGGTGIGLALTRKLVLRMGGDIGFESRPGQGSTFWVTLPLTPAISSPGRSAA